jgi:hypothetical protein
VEECGETVKHPVAEGYDTLMAEIKKKVRPVDDILAQEEDEEGALASLSAETTSDAATNGSRNDVNQIQTSQNIKSHSIKNKSLFGTKQYNCRTRCYIITNIALFTSRNVKEQIYVSFQKI